MNHPLLDIEPSDAHQKAGVIREACSPLGCAWLASQLDLVVVRPSIMSFLCTSLTPYNPEIANNGVLCGEGNPQHMSQVGHTIYQFYPLQHPQTPTEDTVLQHLYFAMSNEPINLEVLVAVFNCPRCNEVNVKKEIEVKSEAETSETQSMLAAQLRDSSAVVSSLITDLENMVMNQPTDATVRKLWYCYEWLTGNTLRCPDLGSLTKKFTNTYNLLDSANYYTHPHPQLSRRHGVRNNCLGTNALCPFVRMTPTLQHLRLKVAPNLIEKLCEWASGLSADCLERASRFLFLDDTLPSPPHTPVTPCSPPIPISLGSFSGNTSPTDNRKVQSNLYHLLKEPKSPLSITESYLHTLDSVATETTVENYRTHQVYLGRKEEGRTTVSYVPPKPEDVPGLMHEFIKLSGRLCRPLPNSPITPSTPNSGTSDPTAVPFIEAAVLSYVFVIIHPYSAGNGRVSRHLLHHCLQTQLALPPNVPLFPLVPYILSSNQQAYISVLQDFDARIRPAIRWHLDPHAGPVLTSAPTNLYRYLDCTAYVEFVLAAFVQAARWTFPKEVAFLETLPHLDPPQSTSLSKCPPLHNPPAYIILQYGIQEDFQLERVASLLESQGYKCGDLSRTLESAKMNWNIKMWKNPCLNITSPTMQTRPFDEFDEKQILLWTDHIQSLCTQPEPSFLSPLAHTHPMTTGHIPSVRLTSLAPTPLSPSLTDVFSGGSLAATPGTSLYASNSFRGYGNSISGTPAFGTPSHPILRFQQTPTVHEIPHRHVESHEPEVNNEVDHSKKLDDDDEDEDGTGSNSSEKDDNMFDLDSCN